MKRNICLTAALAILAGAAGLALAQGTRAKVYKSSADKMVVASGGEIEVESGGTLTVDGTIAGGYGIDTSKITSGVFDSDRIPATLDTTKINSGAFAAARIGTGVIDTTKLANPGAPATGTLLCYLDSGKIGKVTAVVDTGKTGTCAAF